VDPISRQWEACKIVNSSITMIKLMKCLGNTEVKEIPVMLTLYKAFSTTLMCSTRNKEKIKGCHQFEIETSVNR